VTDGVSGGLAGWLGALELAAPVALAASALASVVAALAVPRLLRRWRSLPPARRARRLLAVGAAPVALPALVVALCWLPSLVDAAGVAADHCRTHAGHPHLCLVHRPALRGGWLAAAAVPAGLAFALPAAAALRGARRARGLRRALELAARGEVRGAARIASREPLSCAVGLLRPRIFVSGALAASLPEAQLDVVLAHERAHARRRDPLRLWAAAALSALHGPGTRRAILAELRLACEQACDERAARDVGDPLRVAETLLATGRLWSGTRPAAAACGFGGGSLEARVQRLLDAPAPERPARLRVVAVAAVLLASALLLADPLHHAVEHVLGALVR